MDDNLRESMSDELNRWSRGGLYEVDKMDDRLEMDDKLTSLLATQLLSLVGVAGCRLLIPFFVVLDLSSS